MAPSSRDRISVDLRGLKAALVERARVHDVSPSDLIRVVLARALDEPPPPIATRSADSSGLARSDGRVRLSMRLSCQDMQAIARAADRAGLSIGNYVAGLAAGIAVPSNGTEPADNLAALVASNACMATLGRDLRHLTSLLSQGSIRAAQEYRETLDSVAGDVARHLALSSAVLADLQPLHLIARRTGDSHGATRTQAP